jgi:hypothetical protein
MAALYRRMKAGRFDPMPRCKLVWTLAQLRETIEVAVIERRLPALIDSDLPATSRALKQGANSALSAIATAFASLKEKQL